MFRQVAPAPSSPPLGGSDENSAVRFTPAVKYGGRENMPSRRETRCMSGHPCRAHHKLKWARKIGRCPRASVQASHTLREQQGNSRGKFPLPSSVSPPAQTPQGQPCSTGVGNNPLTITEHSQRAVTRMPKARRSRLSLTRCAGCATLPKAAPRRPHFHAVLTSMLCPSLLNTIVPSSSVRSTFTPAPFSVSIVLSAG